MELSNNVFDVNNLPIADLRRLAATMKIQTEKDWDKSAYISAINARRKSRKVCRIVEDVDKDELQPGFCRIRLHPTSMGTDWPVDVMVNNFRTSLPRSIWVDVPREIRDTIRNSVETATRKELDKNGQEVIKIVSVPCYPFDQYGEAAGESGAIRPSSDAKVQTLRNLYKSLYGRWPKRLQFEDFQKAYIDEFQKKAIHENVSGEDSN